MHFRRDDSAGEDTTTNGDETSERTLLVCTIWLEVTKAGDTYAPSKRYGIPM